MQFLDSSVTSANVTLADGSVYIGGFTSKGPEGKGRRILRDGTVILADYSEGQLVLGTKVVIHRDGSCYDWIFRDGELVGRMFRWFQDIARGDWTYRGDFDPETGIRDGEGESKDENGDHYHGEWKDNRQHGSGMTFYADGRFFSGTFQNGKKVEGTMKLPDDTSFIVKDGKVLENN